MAAVIREVARIRRLVLAIDFTIGVELGLELRRRRKTDRAEFLFFGFVVEHDCRRWTGLRLRARAVGRLALGQHTATAESRRIERLRIASRLLPGLCISASVAIAGCAPRIAVIQWAPSFAVSMRPRGPNAEMCTGIESCRLMSSSSGLRKRILWERPSADHSTVSPLSRPWTTRTYSPSRSSVMARSPIVRRAVNPVPTPK